MITNPSRATSNASNVVTIAGTVGVADTYGLTFTNAGLAGFPVVLPPLVAGAGATATTVAAALAAAIANNAKLAAADISASNVAGVLTVIGAGSAHNATVVTAQVTGTGTATPAAAGVMAGGAGVLRARNAPAAGALTQVPGLVNLGGGFVSGPMQRAVDPVAAGIDVSAL